MQFNREGRESFMSINNKKLAIQILSILGFIMTIKLAMIYYTANFDKYALPSFCSISDFIDCDGAARTTFAQVLGIPLAYWGMLFYITVLFLTFVDKLKNIKIFKFLEVFKSPMAYIAVLGSAAFAISMVLAGISVHLIKKLCILCVVTYIIDFGIAIIAASDWRNYFSSFKTTVVDFIDGAKNYPKTFVVLLVFAISFLSYSGITNSFVPHVKRANEIKKYAKYIVIIICKSTMTSFFLAKNIITFFTELFFVSRKKLQMFFCISVFHKRVTTIRYPLFRKFVCTFSFCLFL